MLDAIKSAIHIFAPTIGGAFGGGFGAQAAKAAATALLGPEAADKPASEVETLLKAAVENITPQAAQKLRLADKQFRKDYPEVLKLRNADRANAREMAIKGGSGMQKTLAISNILAIVALTAVAALFELNDFAKTIVGMVIGALLMRYEAVGGFFFGQQQDPFNDKKE